MKIQNLKIRGFRGFNEETDLTFTTGLSLFYAPNGWGKSSLAEAIEWAVFGDTQRTLDAKSKIEFKGSHRNVHFSGSETVCVGVDCLKDNDVIEILREMDSREEISLCITPDTCSLLETWLVRPIIYQHALQRFIHTEPKKRWDEFANILGLADLEKLRETLVKVKNQGQNAIPDEARQYITKLSKIRATIDGFDGLSDLKRPSETNAVSLALEAVKIGETIITAEGGDKSKVLDELSRILKKRKAEILDVSIFSLKDLDGETKRQYDADKKYITAFNEQALKKIKEYRSQKIADLDARRCNFIKGGLELLHPESDLCPFCGEPTITDELKTKLNKDIEASAKTGELHEKILKALDQLSSRVANAAQHFLPRMKNAPTVQDAIPKIRQLLGNESKDLIDSLEQSVKQIITERQELNSIMETAQGSVDSIKSHFDLIDFDEEFVQKQIANIELFTSKTDSIKENLSFYGSQYASTKERLESKMRKKADIAIPELIIDVLTSLEDLRKAFMIEGYIEQIDTLRKSVEKFHKQKTAERLQEKRDDIQKWYDILNPDEEIGFFGIREHPSRKRWLEVLAQSYGESMSGPACLSESHLNAVGISVYLGQIIESNNPLKFVVIDDPVQSMDEKHSIRFGDVVDQILTEGYQVILLSHQNEIISNLRNRFQDNPDYSEFEVVRYDKSGPEIQEKIPQFKGYLDQAKRFKSGDATCRGASFNFLRKAAERLSKDVYMKGKGVSIAKRYERLDADKMEKLLVDSGIPTYQEIAGMRETFRFSGPPSHDDMTRNPPTPEELGQHISRLETNWKKWI